MIRSLSLALCAGAALVTAALPAIANENAVNARRGYYQIVLFDFGPLGGMAKGEIDYDAAKAAEHAANLKHMAAYPVGQLFVEGTSNEDMAGKTRALPSIWSDNAGFVASYENWKTTVDKLAEVAGNGRGEMAAAFGAVGKSCGACHNDYRAKDF